MVFKTEIVKVSSVSYVASLSTTSIVTACVTGAAVPEPVLGVKVTLPSSANEFISIASADPSLLAQSTTISLPDSF